MTDMEKSKPDDIVTSHELAKRLLGLPDLPIALMLYGHSYAYKAHRDSHGPISVGLADSYAGEHLVIGGLDTKRGCPNFKVTQIFE